MEKRGLFGAKIGIKFWTFSSWTQTPAIPKPPELKEIAYSTLDSMNVLRKRWVEHWMIIARTNSSVTKSHQPESIYSEQPHTAQSEASVPPWEFLSRLPQWLLSETGFKVDNHPSPNNWGNRTSPTILQKNKLFLTISTLTIWEYTYIWHFERFILLFFFVAT